MKKRFLYKTTLLAAIFFANIQQVFADTEDIPPIDGSDDEPVADIDTALLWLLLAGLLLGTYHLLKKQRQIKV